MISLKEFTIKKISEKDNISEFEIGPMAVGYGNTLGNILKRVLTSSIPGAAITAVKIDGVQHEYSTLSGVSDDILTIVLSLKNIVFFSKSNEPVMLSLEVKGKDGQVVEVKASDLTKDADIEVINPDYVITKLTSGKSKFKAQVVIEKGVGYQFPKEEVRRELGMLPVDAIFSPVKLVNYNVVPTRVGQETELDQVNLTVETNGAMNAADALNIASTILSEMTTNLVEQTKNMISGKVESAISTFQSAAKTIREEQDEKPKLLVAELNLSTRLTNALLRAGFDDLNKLEGFTEEELANIRGMGEKSLVELIDILKKHKIKLI